MKIMTGGQAVVKALEFLDVSTIFGIPGVHNLAIYSALLDSSIKHVTVRHEQGAGFMADGYARTTGRVGVALVISGPGLTNILTPMGEAYHEAVPLLVISTNNSRRYLNGRTGILHELSQSNAMTRSVAKESRRVPYPEAIVPYLIEAHQLALEGRPGPVHVEIPLDLLDSEIVRPDRKIMGQTATVFQSSQQAGILQDVQQVVEILDTAQHPLIIIGGGAWQAGDNLTQLADKLAAPILLTPAGKGGIDDDHPLCLGVRHHFPAIRTFVENADVVLAFGTELAEDLYGNFFSTKGMLIRIDRDVSVFERNIKGHICLLEDANTVAELLNKLVRVRPDRKGLIHRSVRKVKDQASQELPHIFAYRDLAILLNILKEIRTSLPKDGILVSDSTRPAYVAFSEFPSHTPRSFLFPCGYGTLGMALPSAIGTKIAHPERAVSVLAGDGGFQFTMAELGTLCQEKLSIPIIVFNDHGFGEIRMFEETRHPGRRIGVDLKNPDFESLATAYGMPFYRILKNGDLQNALSIALTLQGPSLIEIDSPGSI